MAYEGPYPNPYAAESNEWTTNRAGKINASGNANVQIGDNYYHHEAISCTEPYYPHFESSETETTSVAPYSAYTPSPSESSKPDFDVAIFCALPLEADAVETLFDRWDAFGQYSKAPGDPNAYSTGIIGTHHTVLVHMPGMGKSHGASVAAFCRSSFPSIRLALVVGICGGAPYTPDGQEIRLGDVVISSGLVQYDFGRRYTDGLERKDAMLDSLGRPSIEIRGLLAQLQSRRSRKMLQDRLCDHLAAVDGLSSRDSAFASQQAYKPTIHIGLVASGDQVIKSEQIRNRLMALEGVIAFEMESAGIWDTFPCLVIKGVADYADCHKNKKCQSYAAATSAACAKALLEIWN
ncbi:nucleoside phosphorylase domain-containing protein [Aspergillus varians]